MDENNNKQAKRIQNMLSPVHLLLLILLFTILLVFLCVCLEFFFRFVLLLVTHWHLLFFFFSCYSCLLCVFVGFLSPVFFFYVFFLVDSLFRHIHTQSCMSTKKNITSAWYAPLLLFASLRVECLLLGLCQCFSLH